MIRNLNIINSEYGNNQSTIPDNVDVIENFDNSMSSQEIQNLIDKYDKHIPSGSTLTFKFADGTYTLTSTLSFSGFYGGGELYVDGNSSNFTKSTTKAVYLDFSATACDGVEFLGVGCEFYIRGLKIRVDMVSGNYSCIKCGYSNYLNIQYNYVLGTGKTVGFGIYLFRGCAGTILSNYITQGIHGIRIIYGCGVVIVSDNDDTGTTPTTGNYYNSSIVIQLGNVVNGSSYTTLTNYGITYP